MPGPAAADVEVPEDYRRSAGGGGVDTARHDGHLAFGRIDNGDADTGEPTRGVLGRAIALDDANPNGVEKWNLSHAASSLNGRARAPRARDGSATTAVPLAVFVPRWLTAVTAMSANPVPPCSYVCVTVPLHHVVSPTRFGLWSTTARRCRKPSSPIQFVSICPAHEILC